MDLNLKDQDMTSLLSKYNQELALLKKRLLIGEPWENLQAQRSIITKLSKALQNKGFPIELLNPDDVEYNR
jgi:predicted nucleotide-binding protein